MSNNWHDIWEKRDIINVNEHQDIKDVALELKRINGFDITEDGISFEEYQKQLDNAIKCMSFNENKDVKIQSLFEVGCGSGANLLLFRSKYGEKIGGIDFSSAMIESARKVLGNDNEFICDEAVNIDTTVKYDAVLSNSVFSYFKDYEYARNVLEKMLKKCNYAIGLIDIHDIEKKEAFTEYRRKTVENYDVKYANLKKLFYDKKFFLDFGYEHGLNVIFTHSNVKNYWNNEFVFNVFMIKNT